MSEKILEDLNGIEDEILKFGKEFKDLLEMIQRKLNQDNSYGTTNKDFENKLDIIVNSLAKVKEDLLDSTEKIYKENSFKNMNIAFNDSHELKNYLALIDEKFKEFSL